MYHFQDEISSSIDTTPTTSNSVAQNLKEPKKDGANPKHNGISPRSSARFSDLESAMAVEDMVIWAKGLLAKLREAIIHNNPGIHNSHGIHNIHGTLDPWNHECSSTQITLRIIYACSLYASRNAHQQDLQRVTFPLAHTSITVVDLIE
ncbi:hypothetical protein J6590_088790 [Homalodisca vitripennis]|nr:hypothetical protein J6590_088790 [Homalodisca vitripennis]